MSNIAIVNEFSAARIAGDAKKCAAMCTADVVIVTPKVTATGLAEVTAKVCRDTLLLL
jgi:hypothetical protein